MFLSTKTPNLFSNPKTKITTTRTQKTKISIKIYMIIIKIIVAYIIITSIIIIIQKIIIQATIITMIITPIRTTISPKYNKGKEDTKTINSIKIQKIMNNIIISLINPPNNNNNRLNKIPPKKRPNLSKMKEQLISLKTLMIYWPLGPLLLPLPLWTIWISWIIWAVSLNNNINLDKIIIINQYKTRMKILCSK